jgi:hypothetical protein
VPPQVDLRQDGFPVRSHGARIMLLREKMDLLREAQWTELLGIAKEQKTY